MFNQSELDEAERLCNQESTTMNLNHLSLLNTHTDTTFDFTTAQWSCELQGRDYEVKVVANGLEGVDHIAARAWDTMTPKGRELALKAATLIAASNLIDNWKATP